MVSKELARAREYEKTEGDKISDADRPVYHLSPRIGWLNDPNGFSFYNGRYHLFYQYHPYDSFWGPMHWGHAASDDLITWDYLPAALAPDTEYDGSGCFSGSAVTLPDGRQLLMYTSCEADGEDPLGRWKQSQSVAVSCEAEDGSIEYVKYEGNPVITGDDLPEGGDPYEFRDPYIWETPDGYRAIIANAVTTGGKATQLSLYRSQDGFSWEFDKVLFEDSRRIGVMWECPNLFPLDGRWVLIASPMNMEAEEADGSIRFPKGNNVCCMTGTYDEADECFTPDAPDSEGHVYHPVDCGLDFYAPQIRNFDDGRCIMTGWMQDPSMANLHQEGISIFGQMTIPRELSIRDGRLIQQPVRELEAYRKDRTALRGVTIGPEPESLPGIAGRSIDMDLAVSMKEGSRFSVRFACGRDLYTEITWNPELSVITVDRSNSGQQRGITSRRTVKVRGRDGRRGRLGMRLLIDRWSAEAFINDGEQAISLTYYTDPSAEGITFSCDGRATLDVTAYRIET